jgi:hypothetical protein
MTQFLNKKDYRHIRDGLVALLCVGDKIYRIRATSGYNHREKTHYRYYVIATSIITEIVNSDVFKISAYSGGEPTTVEYTHKIDMYNGELYIWESLTEGYEERMKELKYRIESEDTRHEWF